MDSQFRGRIALVVYGFVFFLFLIVPFSSANATGSIGRQVASFCAPAMTSPDVGSCQACHMTTNESNNDLNAAGRRSLGNPGSFCVGSAPAPTPTPPPAPAPGMSGTGTGGGSGMASTGGMRSGMRGMGSSRFRSFRSRFRSSSRFGSSSRFRSSRDDDDDDDDDDDRDDDD